MFSFSFAVRALYSYRPTVVTLSDAFLCALSSPCRIAAGLDSSLAPTHNFTMPASTSGLDCDSKYAQHRQQALALINQLRSIGYVVMVVDDVAISLVPLVELKQTLTYPESSS